MPVDVRALAQAVQAEHCASFDLCRKCVIEPWPCLPRRLADATLTRDQQIRQHAQDGYDDGDREVMSDILKMILVLLGSHDTETTNA